ncbi:MAG: hypothetical protein JSV21_10795 [Nitrospirota bacterium]|nr:MAG: hypothetical protein JSV21_10795 [Nitrospirota bacterium]
MRILYILKQDPDPTLKDIIKRHREQNEVEIYDLRESKDYEDLVYLIVTSDKVISW